MIGLNAAIELPVIFFRMRDVTSVEQAAAMLQVDGNDECAGFSLRPDDISQPTLVHAVLRPWLATIFVVLYFDTKAGRPNSEQR